MCSTHALKLSAARSWGSEFEFCAGTAQYFRDIMGIGRTGNTKMYGPIVLVLDYSDPGFFVQIQVKQE